MALSDDIFGSLGSCRGCGNKCELNQSGFCEECQKDFHMLREQSTVGEGAPLQLPPVSLNVPTPATIMRKQELLDFIVAHATPKLIAQLYRDHVKRLKLDQRWIEFLQSEPNEHKLMRLASSLGWKHPLFDSRLNDQSKVAMKRRSTNERSTTVKTEAKKKVSGISTEKEVTVK